MRPTPSTDYHDYVFKDGRLVGDFEGMYRHSADVPWHQDVAAFGVTAALDLALLGGRAYGRIVDVGCGLGHFTERMRRDLSAPDGGRPAVLGLDVSETAVVRARAAFPGARFAVADLLDDAPLPDAGAHDLVVMRGVVWYVVHALDRAFGRLASLAAPGGRLLVTLPFPPSDRWVGDDVLPAPAALVDRIARFAAIEHWSEEHNADNGFVPTVHVLARLPAGEASP